MKRDKKIRVFAAILAWTLFLGLGADIPALLGGTHIVQAAQNKNNCQKILRLYKNKKYSKAKKLCKKLPADANEKCVKKMPKKMKKAYLKKVRSYPAQKYTSGRRSLQYYFFTDINNDGRSELLIYYGSCEADFELIIFTYKNKKVRQVGKMFAGHCSFYAYPGHNGMIIARQHMFYEDISVLTMSGSKIKTASMGGRSVKSVDQYMHLPYQLAPHK